MFLQSAFFLSNYANWTVHFIGFFVVKAPRLRKTDKLGPNTENPAGESLLIPLLGCSNLHPADARLKSGTQGRLFATATARMLLFTSTGRGGGGLGTN